MRVEDLMDLGFFRENHQEFINMREGLLYDSRTRDLYTWSEVDNSTEYVCPVHSKEQLEELIYLL